MKNCNECNSDNVRYVKYTMINGVEQLRIQCLNCGYLDTTNYKRNTVKNFHDLPYFSQRARELYSEKKIRIRKVKKVLFEYSQERFYKQVEYYRNVYLNSEEWKHKRKLIMDIYDWKCQECRGKASDIHHLTYDRIFKEKFEDLIPLCRSCHSKKHSEWN